MSQRSESQQLQHPAYSTDVAPSDFFLFWHSKEDLTDSDYAIREDLESVIMATFNGIARETLIAVFRSCMERVK
jgi:hypothetical protein